MQRRGDRVTGPYKCRGGYRLAVVRGGIKTFSEVYRSEKEALGIKAAVEREIHTEAKRTIGEVMQDYHDYCTHDRGNKPRTVDTELDRVRRFFGWSHDEHGPLPALTARRGEQLYAELRARQTQYGRAPSAAEHRACLAAAKRLGKWLCKQGRWASNPLLQVEPVGRAKRGEESKPQHRIDEATRLILHCLSAGEEGDAGAAATLCGVVLGMRATAICTRQVRDLDAQGTVLHTEGKTDAGRVALSLLGQSPQEEAILARLRRVLAAQARGKLPLAPLVGIGHDRFWVRRQAHRLCSEAGVPKITAHALRGTHTSLAYEQGESGRAVARSIGHTSEQVAQRHYATQQAQQQGQTRRALRALGSLHDRCTAPGQEGEEAPPVVGAREGS